MENEMKLDGRYLEYIVEYYVYRKVQCYKKGVLEALEQANHMEGVIIKPPYNFKLELCKYFYFKKPKLISWKGYFNEKEAYWEAPSVEIGIEIFNFVRQNISISEEDKERLKAERLSGEYNTILM